MIEQLYATKQEAFEAGKNVGRLDLDDHTKKRIAELETKVRRMRAEAQLCRQDVDCDRERALDRIVEIAGE